MSDEPGNRSYRLFKSLEIASLALAFVAVNAFFFVPVLIWGNGPSPAWGLPTEIVLSLISFVWLVKLSYRFRRAADRQR
jgi:hypothetical protein